MKRKVLVFSILFFALALHAEPGKEPEPAQPNQSAKVPNGRYREREDKMGRGTIKSALTESANTISFGLPYEGEQHAALNLSNAPKVGNTVLFAIERGQFMPEPEGGYFFMVRFDDAAAVGWRAEESATAKPEIAVLKNRDKFIAALLKAKKLNSDFAFGQTRYELGIRAQNRMRIFQQEL